MQHPIGDHALLADGRTAALVDPDGNVAWLCWPRVDSAPCLLSILDDDAGGVFTVAPADPTARVMARSYLPGTLILRTVWRADGGELTVDDALACDGAPRLLRSLRGRGGVEVVVRAQLAPDAARARARARVDGGALRVEGGGLDLAVHAPAAWTISADGLGECRTVVDAAGCAVVLCGGHAAVMPPSLDATRRWFADRVPAPASLAPSEMAARILGEAAARALLLQSAAVLAGLRQREGGIVAAPTTSLPQWPRSSRTWDYRYSWLRDSALAGLAMLRCGQVEDAAGIGDFVGAATCSLPPAVLLCVDGTTPPPEETLDHLLGYGGARPVRVGNAASAQPQLDVAGEVVEFAAQLAAHAALPDSLRAGVARVASWTAEHWREADHGIWEIRGTARHYTHSRVMAWAGLLHAADLAERGVVHGNAGQWRAAAGTIRATVLGGAGALTLHDGGGGPDAALAQAVLFGLFDSDVMRGDATIDSILATLERGGLIDRHEAQEDGLADPCAPFLFPTFWVAEALQRCGRDGSRHFAAAVSSRGPLDLFGEVADPTNHTPLGNYPQVQSHAAFVLAATEGW